MAINIGIIGADGVGKSSLVQRALGLARPPGPRTICMRQDVDGASYTVELFEINIDALEVARGQVRWPRAVHGHMVPRFDGAMVLYDVMNKDSIRDLPPIMESLANTAVPTILVATKCDSPENVRQLDTEGVASAFPACLSDIKISSNVPGTARECLQRILQAVLDRSGRKSRRVTGGAEDSTRLGHKVAAKLTRHVASQPKAQEMAYRRRAASATRLEPTPTVEPDGRPVSRDSSRHSRASSDLSLQRGNWNPKEETPTLTTPRSPRFDSPNPFNPPSMGGPTGAEDNGVQTLHSMLRTPGIRLTAELGVDFDGYPGDPIGQHEDRTALSRSSESVTDKPAPRPGGMTFGELVDRLLAPRMSKADSNFQDVFLCLYRKFSAPHELFSAITARLRQVEKDESMHYLYKTEALLRVVDTVAKWVSLYPGDFARPATRIQLEDLVSHLAAEPLSFAAAREMRRDLEAKVTEDDDTGWEKSDAPEQQAVDGAGAEEGSNTDKKPIGLELGPRRMPSALAESITTGTASFAESNSINPMSLDQERPSQSSEEVYASRGPPRWQFHSYEEYEREAATMVPTGLLPLNKFRYHIFMDVDSDDIADEMTRIDWVMFSSIRTRDMVRHVSLPLHEKEKCRSLVNMNRMVTHFNHVAKWVANMVLIRDKAKHRAACLEKFMLIALKLRQLNNYNGLAAVLAGINGTVVHRLSQTRALVNADVTKRFARLVLLMGTQKSHFAYRLAWENSPLPRIPFMPLHRRDLVSAEEGSRTFIGLAGDKINWRKFEVLGDVLLPIMKSQGQPYPNLRSHEMSRELILDCRMLTDEEDLYQRSVQAESAAGATTESRGKKFAAWLKQ